MLLSVEAISELKSEAVIVKGAKRARIGAGFTLQAAAKELHVSAATVWRWEAGEQTPSFEKIKELADLYGCPPGRLIKSPKPTRYEARKFEAESVEKTDQSGMVQGEIQNE
jgi:transcriptional regulator with XRE-family HTH domain